MQKTPIHIKLLIKQVGYKRVTPIRRTVLTIHIIFQSRALMSSSSNHRTVNLFKFLFCPFCHARKTIYSSIQVWIIVIKLSNLLIEK